MIRITMLAFTAAAALGGCAVVPVAPVTYVQPRAVVAAPVVVVRPRAYWRW